MLRFSCNVVHNSEEMNSEKLSEQQRIVWINCGAPHTYNKILSNSKKNVV